ncbi:MAG: hypothetical protein KatS3mg022_0195 [Armatimonadota bacterium]|nr:MAG: hypothetical protein KatS3mg022_0195 [Armatimonadota bacterium]
MSSMRKALLILLVATLAISAHAQWRVRAIRIPQKFVTIRPAKQTGTPPLLSAQGLSPQQTALIYDNYPNDDSAPHLFYYDPTGNGEKAGENFWVDYDNVGAGGEVRSFEFTAEVTQDNATIRIYFFRNVTPTQPPSLSNLIPLKNSAGSAVFDITAQYAGYYTFTVTLPSALYFDVSGDIGWSVVKPGNMGLYFVTWDFNAPVGRRDAYLSIDGGSSWQLTEFFGHPVANFAIRLMGVPATNNATLFGSVGLEDFGFAVQPPKDTSEPENDAFLPTLEVELRQPGTLDVVQTFYTTPYATEQPDGSHAYSYLLSVVPEGTYDIAFRANHWLRKVIPNVTIAGVTMVDVNLANADIDGDNEVTLFDFGALVAAFGSLPGDPNWSFAADLDGDLEVTLFDFGILVRNFGLIGDE